MSNQWPSTYSGTNPDEIGWPGRGGGGGGFCCREKLLTAGRPPVVWNEHKQLEFFIKFKVPYNYILIIFRAVRCLLHSSAVKVATSRMTAEEYWCWFWVLWFCSGTLSVTWYLGPQPHHLRGISLRRRKVARQRVQLVPHQVKRKRARHWEIDPKCKETFFLFV